MKTINLNGIWELTYNDIKNKNKKWARSIPAIVPGDVHLDFLREGLLPEPLISNNNEKYIWMEEKEWVYRRTFFLDQVFTENKMELICDGLDLTTDIWINNIKVGSSNNMFITHKFDVSEILKVGENHIVIRIDPGFASVEGKELEQYNNCWSNFEPRRPWMRKAQQSFYWDVAPRLVTCGIWRDIYIEILDECVLRDIYVTNTISDETAVIDINTDIEVLKTLKGNAELIVSISGSDTDLTQKCSLNSSVGESTYKLSFTLDNPKLWWPNGLGDPNLYDISVKLSLENVFVSSKDLKYGIRNIEILQEQLNSNEKSFTFVVNGSKVFCKGGNWVPSDSIYARISPEKTKKLLQLAKECNFNMLRVWGGGIYEDKFFYETCDSLGLMVWQDFMYACCYYPDSDEEFCKEVVKEARSVIRHLRNHASIVLWCGNNENQVMFQYDKRIDKVFYGEKIFHEILPQICEEEDPMRIYRPSSPWPGDSSEGDQHVWDYTLNWKNNSKGIKIWDYTEHNHKFMSEFGVFGPSNLSSVSKFMGEHPLEKDSAIWNHHLNYFADGYLDAMLEMYYSDRKDLTLEEFTLAGQMVQAEGLKFILEELRRRMHVCSGTLYWEYNDTWGHIGYSPVDYYLSIKPLYYYMKRAYSHVHVVFNSEGNEVYLLNDTKEELSLEVDFGYMDFYGKIIYNKRISHTLHPNSKAMIAEMREAMDDITDHETVFAFACMYKDGILIGRNRCFLVPIRDVAVAEDTMNYFVEKVSTKEWELTFQSNNFIWLVNIITEEGCVLSDNAFDLWPGEKKKIKLINENEHNYPKVKVESITKYKNNSAI